MTVTCTFYVIPCSSDDEPSCKVKKGIAPLQGNAFGSQTGGNCRHFRRLSCLRMKCSAAAAAVAAAEEQKQDQNQAAAAVVVVAATTTAVVVAE